MQVRSRTSRTSLQSSRISDFSWPISIVVIYARSFIVLFLPHKLDPAQFGPADTCDLCSLVTLTPKGEAMLAELIRNKGFYSLGGTRPPRRRIQLATYITERIYKSFSGIWKAKYRAPLRMNSFLSTKGTPLLETRTRRNYLSRRARCTLFLRNARITVATASCSVPSMSRFNTKSRCILANERRG